METEIKLVKGVYIKKLDGVYESYVIEDKGKYHLFTVNVSEENFEMFLSKVCAQIRTPGFFVLEVPTNLDDEKKLRKKDTDPFHSDVYYLDGGSNQDFEKVLNRYGELLINDGGSNFGFGSHQGYDEIFVQEYKVVNIFTNEPGKYELILEEMKIVKQNSIKTIWDNISSESPGEISSIKINNESIHDAIENLKKAGLYFYERRER
ncbi:hypothetical protein bsdE14_25960 [Clostridium omnivorum]|uniref:Uncharacterized protein n=1 Tax=Clostridium omnivorum TaxID=1604902 RepID=A0ABQ5N7S2_9CLOT|nr:hypothetical protein bsdE14_25960 [Clostridium sp. E14]